MNVDELLDMIDEMIDNAWGLPLSGGRCFIDAEKLRDIIDDIRLNLPQEIKQAKNIVSDRTEIINNARREAESIVRTAEERAKLLVAQEEIVKQAQAKANDILSSAQAKARDMRKAANDYVEDIMRRTDEALTNNLTELRKARQNLRAPKKEQQQE